MKKLLAVLMLLVLLLTAAACGQKGDAAAPPGAEGPAGSDAAPVEGGGAPDAEPYLYCTMEYDRLYAQSVSGGAPKRLLDGAVITFARQGEDVLAALYGGDIVRIAPDGSVETVVSGNGNAGVLLPCGADFLYQSFDMAEGYHTFRYDAAAAKSVPLELGADVGLTYSDATDGGVLLYCVYDPDDDFAQKLTAIDVRTQTELWRTDIGTEISVDYFIRSGDAVWVILRSWEWDEFDDYVTHSMAYAVNTDDGTLTPVELPFDPDEYRLLGAVGSGGYLVEGDYDTHFTPYFITKSGQRRTLPLVVGNGGVFVEDALGDTLLLRTAEEVTEEVLDEEQYADRFHRYLLDLSDGSVTDVTAPGEEGRLFIDGSFPVMDSSTARKPVTRALYRFFCMENGVDGAVPLCSTTHDAWLNIADGGADIALLAAPTEEEQAYLDEKGVEVERKLYGGDGLVFIGNRACGVEDLTLDELRAIFRGEITDWSQLGGTDHPIRVLYRDDQSGSQRLFEKLLFAGQDVPDLEALGFERLDEMGTIVNECLYDPYAIGYSIMTYLNDVFAQEELLAFSLEGVSATPDNVRSGAYPLGTQGYVVIRADEPADSPARRLYDWFGSPVSDNILTSCGVTPLHAQ